jgi:hypothetical protein
LHGFSVRREHFLSLVHLLPERRELRLHSLHGFSVRHELRLHSLHGFSVRREHFLSLAHLLPERRELRLHSLHGLALGSQEPLVHLCMLVEGSELLPKARSHPGIDGIIGDLMGQNRGEQLPEDLLHKNDEWS